MNHLPQIIISLLDNDQYKYSMGQMFLHQFPDAQVEWTYKNRDPQRKFTQEMIDEINYQIDLYCTLRYTDEELNYLRTKIRFLKYDYIDYLSLYQPKREQITCVLNKETMQPDIHFRGPNTMVSYHEVPVMSIVAEVYYRMHYTKEEQAMMLEEAKRRLAVKINDLATGKYKIGAWSEFGGRRRFCREFHEYLISEMVKWQFDGTTFVGTSNVWLAMKFGIGAKGTMAHEAEELVGQGYPWRNPAYSNKFMMEAWHKEYGTDNGIYLTDCIGTDAFLKDFNKMEAILFDGVRHDSGDPIAWGEKILAHYRKLDIDARQKTLLFSDSLDLERADTIRQHFCGRAKVAFGIGTFWTNDTGEKAMNQVIKLTEVNGIPVCKLSDAPGKYMGKNEEYHDYLVRSIKWRIEHE